MHARAGLSLALSPACELGGVDKQVDEGGDVTRLTVL